MKRIIVCLCLFIFIRTEAQQINPVPDYVFSNKMSVGRNAVTDTAAYFSIGPRYGAIRGMMPPMVTDTASMSANKRNGLLIFSIQKNKYLYWDSVGSKWAEMAGTAGSAITGSGVAGYMPEFTTSTNLDTTRLYHSAGRFAIGSTTTTNGVFNVYGGAAYFDQNVNLANKWTVNTSGNLIENDSTGQIIFRRASDNTNAASMSENTFLGQSTLRLQNFTGVSASINIAPTLLTFYPNASEGMRLNTNNELLINTQTDQGNFKLQVNGNVMVLGSGVAGDGLKIMHTNSVVSFEQAIEGDGDGYQYIRDGSGNQRILLYSNGPTWFNGGEVFIGSAGTDAGAYALQVAGSIYNTTGGALAVSSGGIGIGTTSIPGTQKLRIAGGDVGLEGQYLYMVNASAQILLGASQESQIVNSDAGSSMTFSRLGASAFMAFNVAGAERMRINNAGEILVGGADAGAFALQITGAIYNTTTITSGAPTGGIAKPWRLGEVNTVSPTSPNRTIRVEIDGTVYYLHAKTTND